MTAAAEPESLEPKSLEPMTPEAMSSEPADVPAAEPAVAAGPITVDEPAAPEADFGTAEDSPPAAAEPAAPVKQAPAASPLVPAPAAPFALATVSDDGPSAPEAPFRPVRALARGRLTFAPERFDFVGIGATITGYMHGESAAAAAHLRALGGVRSPADMIRLQVGEMQRAADASLTCWAIVARKASRVFAYR